MCPLDGMEEKRIRTISVIVGGERDISSKVLRLGCGVESHAFISALRVFYIHAQVSYCLDSSYKFSTIYNLWIARAILAQRGRKYHCVFIIHYYIMSSFN